MFKYLPNFSGQVWILAAGRLLSQIGSGFTMFYAPIFFVNQVGISSTVVGIAIGSGSLSGVIGRFLGGQWADSPGWGRRRTLLISAVISAIADVFLAMTHDVFTLIIGNLLMGLGIGLYWPATEAAIVDLTTVQQRNEAFAITRLADSLGLGLGVVLGGALIATSGNYRSLFIIDGISFVVFFGIIYVAIAETYQFSLHQETQTRKWSIAFQDRALMVYAVVNILFTTYLAQVQSTMPLYFKNFVTAGDTEAGFSEKIISALFSWHIAFAALCQLPVARALNRISRTQALVISLLLWGLGFVLVWMTGITSSYALFWGILSLGVMSVAMIVYTPAASALVADLAPQSLRAVYLSISSQCWAIGYLIGPPLGGWALDRSVSFAHNFWLFAAASVSIGIVIVQYLEKVLLTQAKKN
ncbi:major facilitator superfamily MFS_1 [Stanieria cyanosphaera PCC 7437]|uniref:Major facilitator superfamily MFS_1 n=1 Tax=Stanieria cyanosphaera (strain ATCC 29371 / PCC 7437) TaxID=111780 RepID=K9XXD3_STAC7|nr:MFS transporter [Stanieria cyanosphaera]AFZ37260.1 major facilitator superfamily MFS_1 [Stanieria cyanosphaera PCC 7437]